MFRALRLSRDPWFMVRIKDEWNRMVPSDTQDQTQMKGLAEGIRGVRVGAFPARWFHLLTSGETE
jgi:hypothetical protein